MRTFKKQIRLIAPLLLIMLISCYPGDDLTIEELDIVATDHNPQFFENNSPRTYHMPDTVGGIGVGIGSTNLNRAEMDFILGEVARNLRALGYDPVGVNDDPDVVVTVQAIEVTIEGTGCIPWYGYWGYYPWYPPWGWGPGYCYPAYYYSYTTGTVTIDMIYPWETLQGDETFSRVWEAGLNGLLRGSNAGNQDFISKNIDKAFEISPYLKP